jgi:hypothetical protein
MILRPLCERDANGPKRSNIHRIAYLCARGSVHPNKAVRMKITRNGELARDANLAVRHSCSARAVSSHTLQLWQQIVQAETCLAVSQDVALPSHRGSVLRRRIGAFLFGSQG